MAGPVLLYIAGLSGCVGTTVAAGVSAWKEEALLDSEAMGLKLGLLTETDPIRESSLDLPCVGDFVVGGWDRTAGNLARHADAYGICPPEVLHAVAPALRNLQPRPSYPEVGPVREWIKRETTHLRQRARQCRADTIIVANLCPTEPLDVQTEDTGVDWTHLTVDSTSRGVTPSRIFFRLAIEAGAHYLNFTPNHAETRELRGLAENKELLFCGRDGKTGQTFLKTILAPAFRDRHLYINGWYSTNLLGNADGATLTGSGALKTKQKSKAQCLEKILGYPPGFKERARGAHQVHIHFYPPRHDAKEAWDNIDFQGFLGRKMQLKLNWLGQDSILAAPSVIDLSRLLAALGRNGRKGAVSELAYFFKDPLTDGRSPAEHSTPEQFRQLLAALRGAHPSLVPSR